MKIHYFKIEDAEYSILEDIFNKNIMIPKTRLSRILQIFIQNKKKNDWITRELLRDQPDSDNIINIGLKYFDKYGFQNETMTHRNYFLELSRYDCIKDDKKPLNIIDWHEDDGAVTDYKVNTIIFYIKKSKDIVGGDFKLKINDKETIIPIRAGMALCFNGNLLHTVVPCFGEGVRDTIVFQIERK